MTDVTVVVGGQFGSEGKGMISAHLTKAWNNHDLAIRVAGPNAGHTVIGKDDREWKLRQVPVAAVSSPTCRLHLAAGSEIDIPVLMQELTALDRAGYNASERLRIHPAATIIQPQNQAEEAMLVNKIGSTGKGIGSARAERIMRTALTWEQYLHDTGIEGKRWAEPLTLALDYTDFNNVLVEGTQGYGLGLHTAYYPFVTSSDCRAIDFLAMAGISPWAHRVYVSVIVVARMYPIRVAGNSGPLKGETAWADLGLPEERTTVTNNVRRVGEWDEELIREALAANGHTPHCDNISMALTMLDQRFPDHHGRTDLDDEPEEFVSELEDKLGTYIELVGTGPRSVVER